MQWEGDAEKLFLEMKQRLIGRPIRFRRLACDTLIFYVDGEPGEKEGYTIWFDPPWHFSSSKGVLAGSSQLRGEVFEDGPTIEQMSMVGGIIDVVHGKPISEIVIDERSHALTLRIDTEYEIKNFVCDISKEEYWHIRDMAKGLCLWASAKRIATST